MLRVYPRHVRHLKQKSTHLCHTRSLNSLLYENQTRQGIQLDLIVLPLHGYPALYCQFYGSDSPMSSRIGLSSSRLKLMHEKTDHALTLPPLVSHAASKAYKAGRLRAIHPATRGTSTHLPVVKRIHSYSQSPS